MYEGGGTRTHDLGIKKSSTTRTNSHQSLTDNGFATSPLQIRPMTSRREPRSAPALAYLIALLTRSATSVTERMSSPGPSEVVKRFWPSLYPLFAYQSRFQSQLCR